MRKLETLPDEDEAVVERVRARLAAGEVAVSRDDIAELLDIIDDLDRRLEGWENHYCDD